jgi:hypothetical protein
MKKVILFFTIAFALTAMNSCKKAVEDSIDCIAASLLVSMESNADANNSKLIHFKFLLDQNENNDFTLDDRLKFDFGDGNVETIEGTEVSHEYASAGSFDVKVNYTLHRGSSSCMPVKEKTITVE